MNSFFNLFHLKFFCDAVTYGSFQEAAKKNFVTQSAVSQAIKKLENVFGIPLITHNRQKLYLTEEGKVVYEQAKEVFKTVQDTFHKVNETKDEITGSVRFMTTKSLGMSFLPPTYVQIQKELPGVDVTFKTGGLTKIRTQLKREEVDFAIVVYDPQFSQFEKISITKGELKLYQSKNLNSKEIFVDELDGLFVRELQEHHDNIHLIGSWDLTARFADFGAGIGFFPDYIVKSNRYPNLELHPEQPPIYEYEICAIHNKSTRLSRAAKAVIEQFTLE